MPAYRQIVDQIRDAVEARSLAAQDKLPSVRVLAKELSLNPNTVARAYRSLIDDGVIHARPGLGVFVSGAEFARPRAATQTATIGVICDSSLFPEDTPNLATHSLLRYLESHLAREGFAIRLMIVGEDEDTDQRRLRHIAEAHDLAGVVLLGDVPDTTRDFLRGVATVSGATWSPTRLPWIGDDTAAISLAMTSHLLERGHRRVALICDHTVDRRVVSLFADGHRAAYAAVGAAWPREMVCHALTGESLVDLLGHVMRRPDAPTGVFAQDWSACRGVITAAAKLGLRIPDDFSLVSYGRNVIHLTAPVAVTAWVQDYSDLGTRLANLILASVRGEAIPDAPQYCVGRVQEGESVRSIELTPSNHVTPNVTPRREDHENEPAA